MDSRQERLNLDEVKRLEAIAEELHRMADEATKRWRVALVKAEGTPLLDLDDREGR